MKHILLCLCFFSFLCQGIENNDLKEKLDSIDKTLGAAPRETIPIIEKHIRTSQKNKWFELEIYAKTLKIRAHKMLGQNDTVKGLIEENLNKAKALNDKQYYFYLLGASLSIADQNFNQQESHEIRSLYKDQALGNGTDSYIAYMYYALAESFHNYRDTKQAISYLRNSISIFEESEDIVGQRVSFSLAARIYGHLKDYQKTVDFQKKALSLTPKDNFFNRSVTLFNIGGTYLRLKQYDLAENSLLDALSISIDLNDNIGAIYANLYLGKVALAQREYIKAKKLIETATAEAKEHKVNSSLRFNLDLEMIRVLLQMKELDLAKELLQEVEVIDGIDSKLIIDYYELSHELYKEIGNFKESLNAFEIASAEKIKVIEKDKEDSIQGLMLKFELDQVKSEYQLLQHENDLKEAKLSRQQAKNTMYLVLAIFAVCIIFVVGYLLYNQVKSRNSFKAMALKDDLTGAPNRRAVLSAAQRRMDESNLHSSNLVVAILDIDDFKAINDNFGHDIGDIVLKIFSDVCRDCIRSHDEYGRYGGEEWLLVLADSKEADVSIVFKRLRKKLQNVNSSDLPHEIKLTFSLGATMLQEGDKDLSQLIKRADENLYEAKQAGKDQYKICPQ